MSEGGCQPPMASLGKAGRTPFAVGGLSLLLLVALSLHVGQMSPVQGGQGLVRMHQQLAAVVQQVSAVQRRHADEHKPALVYARAVLGLQARVQGLRTCQMAIAGAIACPANHLIDLPPPVLAALV